jgi:hypothetical protein
MARPEFETASFSVMGRMESGLESEGSKVCRWPCSICAAVNNYGALQATNLKYFPVQRGISGVWDEFC